MAAGGADAVDHQVANARHRHEVGDPVDDHDQVLAAREGPGLRLAEHQPRASIEAAPGHAAERASTNPTIGLCESFSASPGNRRSSASSVEGLRRVEDVEERVGPGGDDAHAVLLVRLGIAAPQEVLVDVVHEALEEAARLAAAAPDARDQARAARLGRGGAGGRDELVEHPALEPPAAGEVAERAAVHLPVIGRGRRDRTGTRIRGGPRARSAGWRRPRAGARPGRGGSAGRTRARPRRSRGSSRTPRASPHRGRGRRRA